MSRKPSRADKMPVDNPGIDWHHQKPPVAPEPDKNRRAKFKRLASMEAIDARLKHANADANAADVEQLQRLARGLDIDMAVEI